jgi:multiple sugar transport system ATP-binding protein
LKLQRLPKAEIADRVSEAARILGLDEFLDRKPKALSGGQRQRDAMGRAIVRKPQAFLMDEPLSNLDAKLRVQMRSEIARIQQELGVTTLYVTHDQTEAMTMGDRVAVIRKGVLQQVDNPQTLYDEPVNLFVAGFIGSPAMNMFDATLVDDAQGFSVVLGAHRLGLPASVLAARPALKGHTGRPMVLGIRPEDMTAASMVSDAPADRRIVTQVDLREALGSEIVVHCTIAARATTTDDVKELASDVGEDALEQTIKQAEGGRSTLIARLDPRTAVQVGDPIELVVDTERLHFFEPTDGSAIGGRSVAA